MNKHRVERQIAKQERRRTQFCRISQKRQNILRPTMVGSHEKEELPLGDPEDHHQISKDTKYHFNLAVYSGSDENDPALKVSGAIDFKIL